MRSIQQSEIETRRLKSLAGSPEERLGFRIQRLGFRVRGGFSRV